MLYMKYVAVYNLIKKRPDFKQQQVPFCILICYFCVIELLISSKSFNYEFTFVPPHLSPGVSDQTLGLELLSRSSVSNITVFLDHMMP